MSDEIIDEKSTSPEIELEQTPEQSSQGESDIPQKFVGKSAVDVIQAYKELEKDRGRLAQQLGDSRKDKEGLEARYRQSESERMAAYNEVKAPKQVTLQDDEDPILRFTVSLKLTLKKLSEMLLNLSRKASKTRTSKRA